MFNRVLTIYLNLPDPVLISLLAVGTAFYIPLGARRGYIQGVVVSDVDGLASFRPTTGGIDGALDILGTASGGTAKQPFKLKSLAPRE